MPFPAGRDGAGGARGDAPESGDRGNSRCAGGGAAWALPQALPTALVDGAGAALFLPRVAGWTLAGPRRPRGGPVRVCGALSLLGLGGTHARSAGMSFRRLQGRHFHSVPRCHLCGGVLEGRYPEALGPGLCWGAGCCVAARQGSAEPCVRRHWSLDGIQG